MARNPHYSHAAANAGVNAMTTLANGGCLRLYGGVQPADANIAVTTQMLLATVQLADPAYAAASNGVAAAYPTVPAPTNAGTPTWYRVSSASGDTLWDGTAGDVSADCLLAIPTFPSDSLLTLLSLHLSLVE
jgi:hypothetical protein